VNLRSLLNSRKKQKHRIFNYFGSDFNKNVLISYICAPFKQGISITHTNTAEALAMAKVFKQLEFNVDVVDYFDIDTINYSKYDLIIGFGEPLINSFYQNEKRPITIYYGTGMHVCWQNHASLNRIEDVYYKKGKWLLNSGRLVKETWSVQTTLVDYIITMGNETVVDSYRKFFKRPIFNIPVSYYHVFDPKEIIDKKNYEVARKHFLWFGADGMIHKGLDLLLDVFPEFPELDLHICGPIEKETDFQEAYYHELYKTENIHFYGFIDLKSKLYKDLIEKCGFIIFPSCSEGEPSSVINTMYYGLIPVVSNTAGIKIHDFGVEICSLSADSIKETISKIESLALDEIKTRSKKCAEQTAKINSIENYESEFNRIMTTIIQENGLSLN